MEKETNGKIEKKGFLTWMETRVFPFLSRINEFKFLQSVRESVFSSIPFLIIGFIILFVLVNRNGKTAIRALDSFSGTLGLLGVWISFYLPFSMLKENRSKIRALLPGFLSLSLFLLSFPPLKPDLPSIAEFLKLLSKGGIIVAILLSGLFLFLEGMLRRKLKTGNEPGISGESIGRGQGPPATQISGDFSRRQGPPATREGDSFIGKEQGDFTDRETVSIPGEDREVSAVRKKIAGYSTSVIGAFFILLVPVIVMRMKGVNIYRWAEILMEPLVSAGDTLPAAMIIVFLMSLFYLFGIHGSGVVGGAVLPFYLVLYNENVAARAAGLPLPHIITPSFFIWSMIGGTGATLPLCVYMLTSKVKKLRDIAKVSILPSIGNINEPLIFGVPLIMNPIIALPFLFTPVIIAVINYAAVYYNLAGRIFILAPFVIPQPFHAYACTLDVRNIFLLLVDMVVAFVIYYPFFRMLEKEELKKGNDYEK